MSHLFIFDKDENLLDLLDSECYYNDNYKRQLNGEWSFTFYVKFEHLKYLEKPNKIGFYDKEEQFQLFKIQDCEDVFGNEESFEIYCVHDSYSLGELIVEDKRVVAGTARDAITKCLENSNYSVGDIADLGEKTLSFYFISRLQGLYKVVETYGGELDFRFELDENKRRIVKRYVDLKYRLGEDTGLRFTFDLNLKGVTRNRSSEGHFTVLYGRGKSLEVGDGYSRRLTFEDITWKTPTNPLDKPLGDKFLVDPGAVQRWGRIEGIYENDSIEDAEELLKATHKALEEAKEPKISYSATIEDLSNLSGYEHLKFVLGDSIIIQDEKYQLNNEARIVSEQYSIKNKKDPKQVTLGYIQKGISDSLSGGSITNPTITAPTHTEVDDSNFPNTLPSIPILKAKGLFSSVVLEWTFESKTYYNYEIYASKIQHFNPDSSNLIFKGKASSLLHEVKPSETWYYRARSINTHGEVTDMSEEVSATTFKISDATEYFEDVAIKEALIDTLSLDRGWFGQLKGQFLDVKNLIVTDGNNVRTLYVDDFGRFYANVTELKINSKDVLDQEQTETIIEAKAGEISLEVAKKEVDSAKSEIDKTLKNYPTTTEMNSAITLKANEIASTVEEIKTSSSGGGNVIYNGDFKNGLDNWIPEKFSGGEWTFYINNGDSEFIPDGKCALWFNTFNINDSNRVGEHTVRQTFQTVVGQTYSISYYIAGHRSQKRVAIRRNSDWVYLASKEYGHIEGGENISKWVYDSITFVAEERDTTIWFSIINTPSIDNSHFWVMDVCCVEGTKPSRFIPSLNDYSTTTQMKSEVKQLSDRITSTLDSVGTVDGKVNSAQSQIDQQATEIASKVDVNGVKSIVRQSPEDLRVGFNGMTDNLVVHQNGLRTNASDGSYSEFQYGQMTHYIAGADYKYHSLTWVDTIVSTSEWCVIDGTYNVPERYRNKDFNVIATVSHVAFDRNVGDAYKNLNISVTNINPANCSYHLHCTPVGVNIATQATVNASKLEVVVTVIA